MIYIFDIDGTLADLTHRLHFIQQEPKDWPGFFAACDKDEPIDELVAIAQALDAGGHKLVMLSGRSDEVMTQTRDWLKRHNVPCDRLLMRKRGDHREDSIIKAELFDEEFRHKSLLLLGGIFEDRKQVVDMYRAKGLRVFQVAEGNF